MANAQLLHGVQSRRLARLQAGEAVPDQVELPWTDRYFAQLGLVLGVAYRSTAVLTTTPAPPQRTVEGTDYVPTPEPGHRLPHRRLGDGRSTLDAVGAWFTLFTPDPAAWARDTAVSVPLRIEPLPAAHTEPYAFGPHGALLVRPDGHIATRRPDGPPTATALAEALSAVTSRP
ncbi:hypothetical protein AV521_33865 [Streptomyces sp. IMTB 2501]|uniref:aromatic-ring hydroxylase C-terminal domain-containing protein n=1 Tax=Streptomyces sp. IMTB 2501 TaxID=1776340 RepID=UPI00096D1D0C|nr:hypothetical protein [Streptomyces sp. IMTB 2501]OLZ64942.1 hypothetical protein AV521_33865 [Streptomyces sp. IMTB 2501]